VLEALLVDTVDPALAVGRALLAAGGGEPAAPARLHALALWDGRHLCGGRWTLGVLYLLPELRLPRFARFQESRAELAAVYADAARAVTALTGLPEPRDVEDLPFRMVEALVDMRSDGVDLAAAPRRVALACLPAAPAARGRGAVLDQRRRLAAARPRPAGGAPDRPRRPAAGRRAAGVRGPQQRQGRRRSSRGAPATTHAGIEAWSGS